jgi:ribonuclease J
MNLIIHRGSDEIGGTCIELCSGNSRILLDFGMPLVTKSGKGFDFKPYKNLPAEELVKKGVLPDVQGAYDSNPEIDGLLISHPHADHFGLMQYLDPKIPAWLGKATHEILKLNNIFLHQDNHISHPHYFEKNQPFQVGDFKVTPFWNDHSAFDAYSFLIESNGKSVFYSGDFRAHGRKWKVYRWFLHHAPTDVDCLLLEGTRIGRKTEQPLTEEKLERSFASLFKNSGSINYIYTSSQNIDRLVTIYKACLRARKTFVIDVYTANILETLSNYSELPSPLKGYTNLKVLFPHKITTKLFREGFDQMANKFAKQKIRKEEISANPSDFVVLVRPSMKADLEKISVDRGNLIYSMWEGYKKQDYTKNFLDWSTGKGFSIYDLHTSGHADIETLKEMANTIKPKNIVPIHTFNKLDYKKIFSKNILEVDDNESVNI